MKAMEKQASGELKVQARNEGWIQTETGCGEKIGWEVESRRWCHC